MGRSNIIKVEIDKKGERRTKKSEKKHSSIAMVKKRGFNVENGAKWVPRDKGPKRMIWTSKKIKKKGGKEDQLLGTMRGEKGGRRLSRGLGEIKSGTSNESKRGGGQWMGTQESPRGARGVD